MFSLLLTFLPFKKVLARLTIVGIITLALLASFSWHGGRVKAVREEATQAVLSETKQANEKAAAEIRQRVNAGAASKRMLPTNLATDKRGYRD